MEDDAFDHSSFAKNQERLLKHNVSRAFFEAVLGQARRMRLLSSEHFTVDGTLLESWASFKSLQPRPNLGGQRKPKRGSRGRRGGGGRNPEVDFRGEKRSNETHVSTTYPDALLARKGNGREAKLSLAGHVLMENRYGMVVDVEITRATGTSEREAGLRMLRRSCRTRRRRTLGADKQYDSGDFVKGCRGQGHVAQNTSGRSSAIDRRTAGQPGHAVSQRIRKRVEEIFGWPKTVGGGRKLRYLGTQLNQLWAGLAVTAFNLVRIGTLMAEPA